MTNSTITGNSSTSYSFGQHTGGISVLASGNATLVNCVIADNHSNTQGGGMTVANAATLSLTNCTITRNSATLGGGIIIQRNSVTMNNTIVAGNIADNDSPDIHIIDTCTISGSNNLIGNGDGQSSLVNGVNGNLVGTASNPIDPGFVNAANGNYHLAASSQAINNGNNALIPSGITTDCDGNARIYGGTVDIGAYEYRGIDSSVPLFATQSVSATRKDATTISVSWNAVPHASSYVVEYATDAGFTQTEATVYALEAIVNPETRTRDVRAIFPNTKGEWMPGAFVSVEILLNEIPESISIPSQALIPELGIARVFLYKSGKAQSTEVLTGLRSDANVQILSGLEIGDTLLTSGILQLRPGMEVGLNE